ncbi:leucine rich repeat family protein [Stylonychia lemnae]|uniref:Leucine rich repeat family protein n=1 Tax=Stylonychia lemnae TaxID=5949 RepID=A0A078A6N5_STYLE|nr:leucine rich repeat family protein [Stylonychia lemnae]|eukprot:CDW77546.1 leucine rich repeat family protein [Stylonychia lemnae]
MRNNTDNEQAQADRKISNLTAIHCYDFDQFFPHVIDAIQNYAKILDLEDAINVCKNAEIPKQDREQRYFKFFKAVKTDVLPLVYDEIKNLIPEWIELLTIDDNIVCVHTMNVLYLTINDAYYKSLNKEDQNIMKWAILLHDIKKLGPPHFTGKDHNHPFKGGKAVLEVFRRIGLIRAEESIYNTVLEFIENSKQEADPKINSIIPFGQKACQEMHSHQYLSDIFLLIWQKISKRGTFVDMVFRLVFFHQSLIGIKAIPAAVPLTQEERLIYCDEHFFKLIKLLMINDSVSYMYVMDFDDKLNQCLHDFEESSEMMLNDYNQRKALLEFHLKTGQL